MSPIRMSKVESAVRIAIAFNEAFNRHDVASMMQLISEDCTVESFHPAPDGVIYQGKGSVQQYWRALLAESPQAHIEIEDIFGLGKRRVMRWRYDWINEKGDRAYVRGVDIFRITDDLITEQLSYAKR